MVIYGTSTMSFIWSLSLQAILTLGDKDLDGRMDLDEFVQFVNEQQRKLWEVFSRLDANGDGKYVVRCVLVHIVLRFVLFVLELQRFSVWMNQYTVDQEISS